MHFSIEMCESERSSIKHENQITFLICIFIECYRNICTNSAHRSISINSNKLKKSDDNNNAKQNENEHNTLMTICGNGLS